MKPSVKCSVKLSAKTFRRASTPRLSARFANGFTEGTCVLQWCSPRLCGSLTGRERDMYTIFCFLNTCLKKHFLTHFNVALWDDWPFASLVPSSFGPLGSAKKWQAFTFTSCSLRPLHSVSSGPTWRMLPKDNGSNCEQMMQCEHQAQRYLPIKSLFKTKYNNTNLLIQKYAWGNELLKIFAGPLTLGRVRSLRTFQYFDLPL